MLRLFFCGDHENWGNDNRSPRWSAGPRVNGKSQLAVKAVEPLAGGREFGVEVPVAVCRGHFGCSALYRIRKENDKAENEQPLVTETGEHVLISRPICYPEKACKQNHSTHRICHQFNNRLNPKKQKSKLSNSIDSSFKTDSSAPS